VWLIALDNIFVDIAVALKDNTFLVKNNPVPGQQYTATTDELKQVTQEIFDMKDGDEYGSKKISETVGGCAMNTGRAANFYL